MIKAFFFDLDGVIRIWDEDYIPQAEATLGLPAGAFGKVAFAKELLNQVTTGRLTWEEWQVETGRRLQKIHPELDVAEMIRLWNEAPARLNEEVMAFVRRLRREAPVSIITNGTSRLPVELRQLGIEDEFDYIFNTSDLGVNKPDPEVYRMITKRVGVDLTESFFVDDLVENVEAAAALGMRAHLYREPASLRRDLHEAGFAV